MIMFYDLPSNLGDLHNYQGCIKCQMHNTFNSGKNPGTQKLCQLPSQWVEIAGDFAGI